MMIVISQLNSRVLKLPESERRGFGEPMWSSCGPFLGTTGTKKNTLDLEVF